MRKKGIAAIAVLWLAGALFIGSGGAAGLLHDSQPISVVEAGTASSKDIQKKINEANKKRESAEAEKKKLEDEIAKLEEKKSDVLEYIEGLDNKLTQLTDKIEKNEEEIQSLKTQIRKIRKEKKEAEQDRENQYDTMTRRIKYMYENGSEGYLEILLDSGSLSELFNRVEYVNKVTNYDKNMLQNYQKVCKQIQKAQKKLERNLYDLKDRKKSLRLEKASVNTLMEKKSDELAEYKSMLQNKNSAVSAAENLIQQQENELEKLLEEQRKKAEEEAKAAEARDNTSSDSAGESVSSKGGYSWPLPVSGTITSSFGYRTAPTAGGSTYHKGIDISVPVGTSVLAAKAGTVVTAAYSASAGNYIALYHGNGVYTYYMHCSKLSVSAGQKVSKGQQVALSGNTGISTGPHLHFAVYANGSYVNPLNYVSR